MTREKDTVLIETFELSPRNEAVNSTIGRLRRQFPGPTLSMNRDTFNEPHMQDAIAATLSKMSHQSVPGTKPKVRKAGEEHDEDRDTTDPKMVTEFFTAILRPCSTVVENLQLNKNTREEVLWNNCQYPWRRSPLWLLIRVALQLVSQRLSLRQGIPDGIYKHFMIFFMSVILDACPKHISPEKRHMMIAKIARRLNKLTLSHHPTWLSYVHDALERGNNVIEEAWRDIRARNTLRHDTNSLARLDFARDTYHYLSPLDAWIDALTKREHVQDPAEFQPQNKLVEHEGLPLVEYTSDPDYAVLNLAAIENWVNVNLETWLQNNLDGQDTCRVLGSLISDYHGEALRLYSDNPEAMSLMLLTILELWIACDKAAVNAHPMLGDYSACIPMELFESLVLSQKTQLNRLAHAEMYMRQRQRRVHYPATSIFQNFGTQYCFSVRYFAQSKKHRDLLAAIEEEAKRKRTAKQTELRQKHDKYRELTALINGMECTYEEILINEYHDFKEPRHSYSCKRCGYIYQRDSIDIDIHEWPLPADHLKAQSTVFELDVPRPFAFWRDTTAFFLLDVLRLSYSSMDKPRARYEPRTYKGLRNYFNSNNAHRRLGLLSENKPHENTHRRQKAIINVTERDVCLANGMDLHYYDHQADCFVAGFKSTDEASTACTYKLPRASSSLQQFLSRPATERDGRSPNNVIASLNSCPQDMSLEEYRALCSMPLGMNIQWQNILLQLAMPSVVFKKAETCIFILQIISQAGPSTKDSVLRAGHVIINDDAFAGELLARIRDAADKIKENWESAWELCALILLTQRVLSLSSSASIRTLCLAQLSSLRTIGFNWVKLVRDKASGEDSDIRRNEFISHSAQLALVTAGTFDAEKPVLGKILERETDACVWIQCCMLIHDRKGLLDLAPGCLTSILYHRWQILAYRCYPILVLNVVHQKKPVMDLAIMDTWAAYQTASPWSVASQGCEYWITTRCDRLPVHFNLLTGKLLISGRPLARLPEEYESHVSYKSLFGRSPVEVMPSALPGMQFSGQRKHMGYTIDLGKALTSPHREVDLRVRAVGVGQHQIWEFVPPRLLAGAVPDDFIESYAHWYNLDGDYIEFRPVNEPWRSSSSYWQLQRKGHRRWYLANGGMCLVSIKSETAQTISRILEPIEKASRLHCKFHPTSSLVEIEIPRLRLNFSLQAGHSSIRCRQYRGMSIDTNQSLGTLVGLHNKLVLIHDNDHDRKILIPEGNVSWEKSGEHVVVRIGWQAVSNYHVYSVDEHLGRLVDNGNLQSKLILCYLHAVTSFCIPDPLTQKTGTEQALAILRSASTRSFTVLQAENIAILEKIAALTPETSYYPLNERVMQRVVWQPFLGCLAQHPDFQQQVLAILDQDSRMRMFTLYSHTRQPVLPQVNNILLKRYRIRSSSFRVSGFGAEDHTSEYDSQYSGLGQHYESEECYRVFTICKSLYDEIPLPTQEINHESRLSSIWEFLCQSDEIHGPNYVLDKSQIKYDASWLLNPEKFVSKHWCSIHRLFSSQSSRPSKHQLIFWISTLAISDKVPMPILETLAALYLNPRIAAHLPPARPSFRPCEGYKFNTYALQAEIRPFQRQKTPESSFTPQKGELYKKFTLRIQSIQQSNSARALNHFIDALRTQWPASSPTTPSDLTIPKFEDYFEVQKVMNGVRLRFLIWFHNIELREYLSNIVSSFSEGAVQSISITSCPIPPPAHPQSRRPGFFQTDDILDLRLGPPPIIAMKAPRLDELIHTSRGSAASKARLLELIEALGGQARSDYEKQYVMQLSASTTALHEIKAVAQLDLGNEELEVVLFDYIQRCEAHQTEVYGGLLSRMNFSCVAIGTADLESQVRRSILKALSTVRVGPRLSPTFLLEQLTRKRWSKLSAEWKRCFITYGLSITTLQQAKRLLSLIGRREDLVRELQNPGHTNWDPYEFPESLVLEIENGLLIRDVQEQIAQTMRSIQPGQNAVMQLNMGEGKSSVIVPIVAAALADGACLVRVLVAKPQSRQMFDMLVLKLGGLLGRRVYHLPISRSLHIDERTALEIGRLCSECMTEGGVLLVQPEHILSLKLMCLECFINGNDHIGNRLLKTLELFRASSRDLVDESDENFSARFELIYTMGTQRALELSPQRWTLTQEILGLVRTYAPRVKDKCPQSIEVGECHRGGFPRIRLLREDATTELFNRICEHICNNGLHSLPISRQPGAMRRAIRSYILDPNVSAAVVSAVEGGNATSFWTDSTKDPLLLLRGLLAGGTLASCFGQKRWRVNYGPHDSRKPPTKLSVPYRAKDNPALRSEFSHPDVVVVLTCLSYYYAGLGDDDLFTAFQHLLKSDQAETEYKSWVDDAPGLRKTYHHLRGINLRDQHHCLEHVFPALRTSKGAIDYFLAHLVFSKEMKEFPSKLSASGWDIGEIKAYPTVGFSGTNDSRVTLPLSVKQLDLTQQSHTNALVLAYLLQPENSVTFVPVRSSQYSNSDAQVLLDMVVDLDRPTRVILDVGAQILELTNQEVAQTWLNMMPENRETQAVVFVNDGDEICIVDRTGLVEPLRTSPFANQLEVCLVFLDEAHTRGIDLRLPDDYRAAVTLGAGITKDKLVQGEMNKTAST